ncbi:metallophosphoesterase family protein [Litchfieldia salsa]|uniref:3',5'-cyclic AMP phosphodiesterase CpdA n=1 Tax=Litchfieldia salsa TaxID=930152 RepID=A0A1H0VKA7_9BACI|nr:metallophosphoesterase [Litchfieldia salsa]SDP78860.1 3',5'-cyclic AMP phosphodiesterase CpdA [Litchfieldia salsa]
MKIAMIGDLHYPTIDETIPGLEEARSTFYERFMNLFLGTEANFHVSIGDLTNFGTTEELKEIYRIINNKDCVFYHALGNHDLYSMTKKDVLNITGQAQYHSFETDEAILVFLDTAKEMDYMDWGGWVDNEQLSWLEKVVQSSGEKPMLVFAHHPVHNTTVRSDKDKGSIHPDVDMWSILDQKKGIGVYFNGHTHVDSIVTQGNWTFIQKSACLDQQAMRLIEINEDEILVKAIDLTDPLIEESSQIIANNILHFSPQLEARGTEENRNCRIPLLSNESNLLNRL